jgi:hypothetical protein
MSSKTVAYNLCLDVVDRTAQDVVNANPGMFSGTIYAPASSYVPKYLYTSLGTLWMGTATASSVFAQRIAVDLGTGASDARGSIVVITNKLTESVRQPRYGMDSDQPGAVEADMSIYMYRPKASSDTSLILNSAYRINYILDNNLRQARFLPPDLQITQDPGNIYFDNTVVSNEYYKCFFENFNIPVQASAQEIEFCSSYVRVISR